MVSCCICYFTYIVGRQKGKKKEIKRKGGGEGTDLDKISKVTGQGERKARWFRLNPGDREGGKEKKKKEKRERKKGRGCKGPV